jgi:dTMP kinase
MEHGELYIFEGPDGVGKSTLAAGFADKLRALGVTTHLLAFPGREAGTLGRLVWEFHHSPDHFGVDALDPTSLQLLHVAAHIDTIERKIRPAIAAGETVVLDRYWWSTKIYGALGGASPTSIEKMINLEQDHWGEITPTATFVIHRERPFGEEIPVESFRRMMRAYLALASAAPEATVFTNDRPVSIVLNEILSSVTTHRVAES